MLPFAEGERATCLSDLLKATFLALRYSATQRETEAKNSKDETTKYWVSKTGLLIFIIILTPEFLRKSK